MSTQFKVACIQNCAIDDVAHNLAEVSARITSAAEAGAQLICLPEYFGYLAPGDGGVVNAAQPEAGNVIIDHCALLARDLKVWLLLGSVAIKLDNGRVHNRSLLLSAAGNIVARYNKAHLFDVTLKDAERYCESASVEPGTSLTLAQTPFGKLGLSVCYDLRFAYLYRALAQAGADFLSIPAAFTQTTGEAHWHTLVRARAIETGCYVFAPGQCGVRPWGRATYGHSLIVDPWGGVLAQADNQPGFVIATVDSCEVQAARAMIPALTHDQDLKVLSNTHT